MMVITEDATLYDGSIQAEAILGHAQPLIRLGSISGHALVMAIQGGVFGRFRMDSIARELITTDWMFAIPFYVATNDLWIRLKYQHISSHIGDEYVEVFQVSRLRANRDAVSLAVHKKLNTDFAIYGVVDVAGFVEPNGRDRWVLQAGAEWTAPIPNGSLVPFAATDFHWSQDSGWRTGLNIQAGVDLFPNERPGLRLFLNLTTGPSVMGEFHQKDETAVSLGGLIFP